jgi:tetratricopeptide (TPR) repeat protein
MFRSDDRRHFLALAVLLIIAGFFRSAWATRRDGFTIDEPWHVTAGIAYLRTGEHYLNPEHPPLVKIVAASPLTRSSFHWTAPGPLHDKKEERDFVEAVMYTHNDADSIHSRVRWSMYLFNGLLLLFFALSAFRVFGGIVASGALAFLWMDPTVAAHWPVVMTDLPVALLSATSVLLLIAALRQWTVLNLSLLAVTLGLTLSVKHSGIISFGFIAAVGLTASLWQIRRHRSAALRKCAVFVLVLAASVMILWSTYGFHYYESQPLDKFNRPLAQKIADVHSPVWRTGLAAASQWRLLPRSYVWGLADIVRVGMEGRAYSTYAFGRLTFMQWRPFIFPGYILARLPIPLLLLSFFGAVVAFTGNTSPSDKAALTVLVLLSVLLLLILANSAADYAGVRHALTVYVVLALLAGIAVRRLLASRQKILGLGALAATVVACFPALAAERPWEYHNFIGGGTRNAYRYFRNDGVDLGQRDREIAEYCHRKLEPLGDVPYVLYYQSLIQHDLVAYRHLHIKVLDDPSGDDFPPVTVSGTLLILATAVSPAIWSDYKTLRDAQPTDRIGNVLVYRGTYYLPNARADALMDRAEKLLTAPIPDFPRIESMLKEGLALRPNDFGAWMLLGNLYLRQGWREKAIAAYQESAKSTPPSPVRQTIEHQIALLSTQPINTVTPLRDPSME